MVIEDSNDAFDLLSAFMAKDDDEEVTLLDIKQNLNSYSLKRLTGLASILIYSLVELINEKEFWGETLEVSKNKKL